MKKIFLFSAVVFLLAAGCGKQPVTSQINQPIPTPTPTLTPTPTPLPTGAASNIFNINSKPGEKFGGMTLTKITAFDQKSQPTTESVYAEFTGKVNITGTLGWPSSNNQDGEIGPSYSVIDLNVDSLKQLPYFKNDNRTVWFGINNPETLKSNHFKNGDRIELTINKYYYKFLPSEVWNTADAVSAQKAVLKTYSGFGAQFMYPSDWQITLVNDPKKNPTSCGDAYGDASVCVGLAPISVVTDYQKKYGNSQFWVVNVTIFKTNKTLKDWCGDDRCSPGARDVGIGGYEALHEPNYFGDPNLQSYYVKGPNTIVLFQFSGKDNYSDSNSFEVYSPVFEDLVKTVRFSK